MPDINSVLNNFGLNQKEIQVYLACLELGGASVQELSQKSGVKRTSIYNFLDNLKKKGLILEIKQHNKTLLVPEDPHVLKQNLEEKIKQTSKQTEEVEDIMPDLMSIFNVPGTKAKIKHYQGIEGLQKMYNNTLIPNSKLYGWIDIDAVVNTMGDFIWDYVEKRVKLNIDYKVITKHGKWEENKRVKHNPQKREVKFVENVKFDTEIDVYANKVAIYSFKAPYAGVVIEDQAIHQTLKSIWGLLWEKLD